MIEEKKQSAGTPAVGVSVNKVGSKKDDDKDDPIAKSLKQRVAAGGLTAVVENPQAKKEEAERKKKEEAEKRKEDMEKKKKMIEEKKQS